MANFSQKPWHDKATCDCDYLTADAVELYENNLIPWKRSYSQVWLHHMDTTVHKVFLCQHKKAFLNFTLCFRGERILKMNSGKSCLLCFISALTSNLWLMHVSKILFPDPQLRLKLLFLIINSKHSYTIWELGLIWSRGSESTKWCFFIDWNTEQSRLQSRSDYTYHCYVCLTSRYLLCYSFQMTINDCSISQCLWSICLSFLFSHDPFIAKFL